MPLGGPPLISVTKTAKSMMCLPGESRTDHHADEQIRNKKDVMKTIPQTAQNLMTRRRSNEVS